MAAPFCKQHWFCHEKPTKPLLKPHPHLQKKTNKRTSVFHFLDAESSFKILKFVYHMNHTYTCVSVHSRFEISFLISDGLLIVCNISIGWIKIIRRCVSNVLGYRHRLLDLNLWVGIKDYYLYPSKLSSLSPTSLARCHQLNKFCFCFRVQYIRLTVYLVARVLARKGKRTLGGISDLIAYYSLIFLSFLYQPCQQSPSKYLSH